MIGRKLAYYRTNARERFLSCNLAMEDIERLCVGTPCAYCGKKPYERDWSKDREFVYFQGIDRVNNRLGYEPDNCVPSCKTCNRIKGNRTPEQLEKAAAQAAEVNGVKPKIAIIYEIIKGLKK